MDTNVTAIKAQRQIRNGKRIGTGCAIMGAASTGFALEALGGYIKSKGIKSDKSYDLAQKNYLEMMTYRGIEKSGLEQYGVKLRNLGDTPKKEAKGLLLFNE